MIRRLTIATLVAACVTTAPAAQQPAEVGPRIGERVPSFSLTDQGGRVRTLESIMGSNGAIIVFYRSADW